MQRVSVCLICEEATRSASTAVYPASSSPLLVSTKILERGEREREREHLCAFVPRFLSCLRGWWRRRPWSLPWPLPAPDVSPRFLQRERESKVASPTTPFHARTSGKYANSLSLSLSLCVCLLLFCIGCAAQDGRGTVSLRPLCRCHTVVHPLWIPAIVCSNSRGILRGSAGDPL